jgi:hypothetical protein
MATSVDLELAWAGFGVRGLRSLLSLCCLMVFPLNHAEVMAFLLAALWLGFDGVGLVLEREWRGGALRLKAHAGTDQVTRWPEGRPPVCSSALSARGAARCGGADAAGLVSAVLCMWFAEGAGGLVQWAWFVGLLWSCGCRCCWSSGLTGSVSPWPSLPSSASWCPCRVLGVMRQLLALVCSPRPRLLLFVALYAGLLFTVPVPISHASPESCIPVTGLQLVPWHPVLDVYIGSKSATHVTEFAAVYKPSR